MGSSNSAIRSGGSPGAGFAQPGGGRKRAVEFDPSLRADLEALIEPVSLGDPESPLRWTTKSVRRLAAEFERRAIG